MKTEKLSATLGRNRPTCGQSTAIPGPGYQQVKTSILDTIERLRATSPTTADYLDRRIFFEDARQTVEYNGIDFPDLELN